MTTSRGPAEETPGSAEASGSAEMAALIDGFCWVEDRARSGLGLAVGPAQLGGAAARHPPARLCVGWGEDLVMVYSDAYARILGDKHPGALGRPAGEVWPENGPVVAGFD